MSLTREAQASPRHASLVVLQSNQASLPDDLPPVPVFDRSLPVKQMHVLETLDLLVLRADKGAAPLTAAGEEQEGGWLTAAAPGVSGSACVGHITVPFPGVSAVVLC